MGKVLKGGIIVTSKAIYKSDIRLEGEIISHIGENIQLEDDEIIDVEGCYLLPGGIDVHTHFDLDVGSTRTADDFESGTKGALVGGTTTIIDFVNHKRGSSFTESLEYYRKISNNKCFTDYSFHMSISEWNLNLENEIEFMVKEGITSFKLYMAYKDILQVEDYVIEKVLLKAKKLGVLLSFHCEDGDIICENIKNLLKEGKREPIYHEKSRDDEVELSAIKRLIDIGDKIDYPIYIVHLSSKKSLEEVRKRRNSGSKIIVETCPQYLLLDKEKYKGTLEDDFEGGKYILSPPLRNKEDNLELWNGLNNNEIQVLATDHCSFNYKGQKDIGKDDFSKVPNGIPGVQHRIILAYSYGVLENKISLNKLVEICSENPAKIFGLYPKKGVITKGSYGDIVVIDPNCNEIITWEKQLQNVDYTPYEGFKKSIYIKNVFLRGVEVVRDEKLIKREALGIYLKRDRFQWKEN